MSNVSKLPCGIFYVLPCSFIYVLNPFYCSEPISSLGELDLNFKAFDFTTWTDLFALVINRLPMLNGSEKASSTTFWLRADAINKWDLICVLSHRGLDVQWVNFIYCLAAPSVSLLQTGLHAWTHRQHDGCTQWNDAGHTHTHTHTPETVTMTPVAVHAPFIKIHHHTNLDLRVHRCTAGLPLSLISFFLFFSQHPIPQMRVWLTPAMPVGRWFPSVKIMSPVLTSSLG